MEKNKNKIRRRMKITGKLTPTFGLERLLRNLLFSLAHQNHSKLHTLVWSTKPKVLVIIALLGLILSIMPFVHANFVCGQVNDSPDNNSAAWYNVNIYYSDLRDKYSSCEVSPAENKFCCDAENISGRPWRVGQTIFSEVYDPETGYLASPVSLISNSEGYNVFPVMNLEKAIRVYSPISRLIISNDNSIMFNSSFLFPYNFVQMENRGNKTLLCDNCTNFANEINFDFGMNHPKIIASNGNRIFSENMYFAILKNIEFSRSIQCDKCKKNIVPGNKNITMGMSVNLSDEVIGMKLREYVPIDFDILNSDGGEVKPYSPTHNVIEWNASGKDIEKSYSIKSPRTKFLNSRYIFKSEIENLNLSEEVIVLKGILPIFSLNEKINFSSIKKKSYRKIGPNRALVLNLVNKNIIQLAVFPNKQIKNAEFELKSYKYKGELENVIEYFIFDSNIKLEDINKLYIKFRLNKKMLKNNKYNNASLFMLVNSSWEEANLSFFRQDKSSNYYEAYAAPADGFAIVGEK